MTHAILPGSFDPITNGHLDIIERCARIFDRITVAVLVNSTKQTTFTTEERVQMIEECTKELHNCSVGHFDGLLVEYASSVGAGIIVKGIRTTSDYDYEFQMALLNKHQSASIETFFMIAKPDYSGLSSSSVKEIARLGGRLDGLVPENVIEQLKRKVAG